MANVTLTINMDSKCAECGKPGATPSGICMKCAAQAMKAGAVMRSTQGKAVQKRYVNLHASWAKRVPIIGDDK